MKKSKKISLDKIKIARLTNLNVVKGGSIIITEGEDPLTTFTITDTFTDMESACNHCETSTKTVPVGTGSFI